ncbi:unnamed protein product [Neospora caninum Liverpool]|uniref:Rhoptry kinase family protein ROP25, putative n=1 Tax=Neospora caninum (strain Liverpool) TaxID=572307 RepID=F0VFD0_NEOCL|nr:uncharacterized protein NCLIV_022130 [Neospora caninum Liverpool]CBZ52424.1 unnamed protein product [Neospora caninum Liverpool]CEL66396.1 TPA: Rhoptry kinase family protein ROP25, putative [Neospora caninum Liverpool]|eukprot:XP_003882456.1 uncharacterized protein NCLIV_022130 [Neospora caninum Liverpool]
MPGHKRRCAGPSAASALRPPCLIGLFLFILSLFHSKIRRTPFLLETGAADASLHREGSDDSTEDRPLRWDRGLSAQSLHARQTGASPDKEIEAAYVMYDRITRTQSHGWTTDRDRRVAQLSGAFPYGSSRDAVTSSSEARTPKDRPERLWEGETNHDDAPQTGGSGDVPRARASSSEGFRAVSSPTEHWGDREEPEDHVRLDRADVVAPDAHGIQFSAGWEETRDASSGQAENRQAARGAEPHWREGLSRPRADAPRKQAGSFDSPAYSDLFRASQDAPWPSLLPASVHQRSSFARATHIPTLLPSAQNSWATQPSAFEARGRVPNYKHGQANQLSDEGARGELSESEASRIYSATSGARGYGRAGVQADRRRDAADVLDDRASVNREGDVPGTLGPSGMYPTLNTDTLLDQLGIPRASTADNFLSHSGRSGAEREPPRPALVPRGAPSSSVGAGDNGSYALPRDDVVPRREHAPGRLGPSLLPGAVPAGSFDGRNGVASLQYQGGLSAFRRPAVLGQGGAPGSALLVDSAQYPQRLIGSAPVGYPGPPPTLLSSSPFLDAFMQNRGGIHLGAQPFATQSVLSSAVAGSAGSAASGSDKWWREKDGWVWPELPALSPSDIEAGIKDISGHSQMVRIEAHLARSQVNAGHALGQYINPGKRYELFDVEDRLPVMVAARGKILGFGAYGVVVEFVDVSGSMSGRRRPAPSEPSPLTGDGEGVSNSHEAGRGCATASERDDRRGEKADGGTSGPLGPCPERSSEASGRMDSLRRLGSGALKSVPENGAATESRDSPPGRATYAAKIMYWSKAKSGVNPEEVQSSLSDFVREELEAFRLLRETDISDDDLFHKHGLVVPQGVRRVARLPPLLRASAALFPDTPLFFLNELIMYPALKCSLDMMAQDHFTREGLRVLVRRLVKVVAGLHQLGFTHNDIKPQNFLVGGDGMVYVGDFAYLIPLGSIQDCNKGFTIDYSSPELMACALKNRKMAMGPERDSWAVGVSAYRLACKNKFPFSLDRKFNANSDPRHIAAYIAGVKESDLETSRCGNEDRLLMSIVLRLLQPDPAKRATVDELVKEPFFQD